MWGICHLQVFQEIIVRFLFLPFFFRSETTKQGRIAQIAGARKCPCLWSFCTSISEWSKHMFDINYIYIYFHFSLGDEKQKSGHLIPPPWLVFDLHLKNKRTDWSQQPWNRLIVFQMELEQTKSDMQKNMIQTFNYDMHSVRFCHCLLSDKDTRP